MNSNPPAAHDRNPFRRLRRTLARVGFAMFAAAIPIGFAGCASDPTAGYSMQETFREDIRTIAVPIFTNTTFYRDVQYELADALIKQIESQTPWKVVGSQGKADTLLRGTITDVSIRRLSKSPTTGLAEEDTLTITVNFEWRDQRTGETLVERRAFAGSGLFVPTITSNEPIELGRAAAVQVLANDIVGSMRTTW